VGLEKTWIGVGVRRSLHAHAAVGFLQHDGEDESLVDASGKRDIFDGGFYVVKLLVGVIDLAEGAGARGLQDLLVGFPHAVEGEPLILLRPAGICRTVAFVGADVSSTLALIAAAT
jgi:hypothetical protein